MLGKRKRKLIKESSRALAVAIIFGLLGVGIGALWYGHRPGSSNHHEPGHQHSDSHYHGHGSSTPDLSSAVETDQEDYSNQGFYPQVIKVKEGTEVTFTNNSSRLMQPASGPHPSHNAYPEFDAKKPLKPGEKYSFIFQKHGTWGYHNHYNEDHVATVIVE